jgi:hypothetical protein
MTGGASPFALCGWRRSAFWGRQEQPLVVPHDEHTKQAPARCMTMPHW